MQRIKGFSRASIAAAIVVLAFSVLLLPGCRTPQDRIDDNTALFSTYPPDVQALIRAGTIGIGFDRAQTQMALGDPDLKQGGANAEEWLWTASRSRTVEVDKDVHQYALERDEYEQAIARGEKADEPSTTIRHTQKRKRVERVVRFNGGRVTSFEEPVDSWLGEWETTSSR